MDDPQSRLGSGNGFRIPSADGQEVEPDVAEESIPVERRLLSSSGWALPVEEEVEVLEPPTAEELEEIRKAAYEEGFASGKEQGFNVGQEQALEQGKQETTAAVARLKQIMHALLEPISQQDNALETVLVDCVAAITKNILRRELKIDSTQIANIVQEALASLSVGHQSLRIHLHPRDAELVLARLKTFHDYNEQWRIVEHATLSPGGCIVETESASMNLTVDERVSGIIQQIYDQEFHRLPGHQDQQEQGASPFESNDFLLKESESEVNAARDTVTDDREQPDQTPPPDRSQGSPLNEKEALPHSNTERKDDHDRPPSEE